MRMVKAEVPIWVYAEVNTPQSLENLGGGGEPW